MKKLLLGISVCCLFLTTQLAIGQAVVLDPPYPAITGEVTITFDVTQASNQSLLGATDDVFLWSGAGSGSNAFEYQPMGQTDFGAPFEPGRMTFLGDDRWEITLVIKDYYSIPDSVEIIRLGLLLKNADGSAQTEDFNVEIALNLDGPVELDPPNPEITQEVTIRFDVKQANNQSLLGATEDVFLWSGAGSGPNAFEFTPPGQDDFGAPFEPGRMTYLGNDQWEITLIIKDYYDIPDNTEITKLGLLLKNADGSAQTEDFVVDITVAPDEAVVLVPAVPSITEEVTIIFDVKQSNDPRAQGLLGRTDSVYLWSGAGSGNNAFEFQPDGQNDFGQPFIPGTMTFLGDDRWEITLVIKDYYGVPDGVDIIKLGLLLKNADGSSQTEDFIVDITGGGADAFTFDPEEPTLSDALTITVDLKQANDPRAEGLLGQTDGLFLWSGVGDQNDPFRFGPPGQNNFSAPVPGGEMTPLGDDVWQITVQLNEFYDIPLGVAINRLGFLVKNTNGSSQTEDFNGPIAPGGNYLAFISPAQTDAIQFVEQDEFFTLSFGANSNGDLEMFIDEGMGFNSVASASNADTLDFDYQVTESKTINVRIQGTFGSEVLTKEREVTFFITEPTMVMPLPAGVSQGINYDPNDSTKVTLALLAPNKSFVYVVGTFNGFELNPDFQMKLDDDMETFWLEIDSLEPGVEYIYQYWVDGGIKVGDPYGPKVVDPTHDPNIPDSVYPDLIQYADTAGNGIASVLQTAQMPFEWDASEESWTRPPKEDLVIYELLVRDFLGSHDYKDLVDTLSYLKRLGVNAIELMPIMEFEGNSSWGYNPSYLFATDKYYGRGDDLRAFIQKAHQEGFAVLLDMVLNHHFGQSPLVQMYFENGKPSAENPWFNTDPKHPFNVGFDMNHESDKTKKYIDSVNVYWLDAFHFDGFRFDLSKGFTQTFTTADSEFRLYDQSRVDILTRMANTIWDYDSSAYVVLEHFAEEAEENVLADEGMLLWGNFNFNFRDLLSGRDVNRDLDGLQRLSHVNYMESHDEERLVYDMKEKGESNEEYNIMDSLTAFERSKLGAAFFYTLPGPKLMWQFQELGYDIDINFNGRTGEKPQVWGDGGLGYYEDTTRTKIFDSYGAIINLTHALEDVFASEQNDFWLDGSLKRIRYEHDSLDLIIIGNFALEDQSIDAGFTQPGTWYDYFTGDSILVIEENIPYDLLPGEFHIFTTKRLPVPGKNLVPWTVEFDLVTGLNNELFGLSVYPNPVQHELNLSGIETQRIEQLSMFTIAGVRVDLKVNWTTPTNAVIDTTPLRNGLYVMEIELVDGNTLSQRIIINH